MTRTDYWLIGVLVVCVVVASVPRSVGLTVLSVLAGGAISGVISWYYYKRAGDELRDQAANLQHYTSVVLRVLEDAGYHVPRNNPDTREPLDWVEKRLRIVSQVRAKQADGGEEPRS
jgi:hypothetical protein